MDIFKMLWNVFKYIVILGAAIFLATLTVTILAKIVICAFIIAALFWAADKAGSLLFKNSRK